MSAQQKKHPFDFKTQYGLGFSTQDDEIVVDFFCGGGGAGTGLEMGLGRAVNVAKNHSPQAISMHTVNHPGAVHYTTDVFEGDPDTECGGKAVGWFHMSPDCTHHSQAAGGQPRKREIRNLSWIGLKWAGKKKPRVISLENVKQILQWGPLIAKRCKDTGRVVTLDLEPHPTKPKSKINRVAGPGEIVPVHNQFLVPNPKRRGQTWAVFVSELRRLGYVVEWRVLKACDYGAPTSRERLFMIARCDGHPIVWPEPTHAKNPAKGQMKWRTAAECIDWTVPTKSIFGRPTPLADATLRRIAKGMKKFVIDAADPFIVPIANWSGEIVQSAHDPLRTVTSWPRGGSFAMASPIIAPATHQGSDRINDPHAPLPTVTCANRGELTLISPVLVGTGGPEYSGKPTSIDQPSGTLMTQNHRAIAAAHLVKFRFADEGKALDEPLPTITSGGNHQRPAGAAHAMGISTVFMAQMNGGFNTTAAKSMDDPLTTVTNTGSQHQLVTATLITNTTGHAATDLRNPVPTVTTGQHHAICSAHLTTLRKNCIGRGMDEPVPTMTAGAEHHALLEYTLSPEHEAGALRVAAFLISYYGTENMSAADAPAPTITTKDRLGLVTVTIKGTPYVIVDICLRMLQPAERYKAQGFPADYIISHGADGKPFTNTQQVHMCGNSVSPPPMAALARANDPWRASEADAKAA
ncbi:DNA (cytosine-5)-methyltransferase 1 [Pseudomonas reinekei]|uniref:DNA (cytosine-5-)-methyltransferase n=1 Tax=Pseudomonas reinekei TaxID=395598 RepID=A0A1H0JSY4_PSERE|nr:DNA cytosine methyltransferase [Pseudomonas reinekei]KAB0479773.1 DNA cytosine methyltransferase [Pseudomonas reinekei]OLT98752.1 DNA cytosine methyltransferase [Pseudomonas reinekei]SDO46846.1 DNA (cytosine-5)-methyltransferase 1 [Pseudomonas reinekei]